MEIQFDPQTEVLLKAHADETGRPIHELLAEMSAKDIVRTKLHQALGRELDSGRFPAELTEKAIAFSEKVKSDRNQAKAKAVV